MNIDYSLLPEYWLNNNDGDNIYSSVYYCISPGIYESLNPIILSEVLGTYFIIFEGEIKYDTFLNDFDGKNITIKTSQCEKKGVFIKFFSKGENENEAFKKIEFVKGLLINSFGTQFCYWHILDETINIKKNESSLLGPSIKIPLQTHELFSVKQLEQIKDKLIKLTEKQLNIISLALRWVHKSANEIDNIDEFLKLWFSIETLGMSGDSNIKPLCIKLGKIYNISSKEAKERFYLGRITGLRSSIVHDGSIPIIHSELLKFLRAIIFDLIYDELGMDGLFKANSIIQNSYFPLKEWLPL